MLSFASPFAVMDAAPYQVHFIVTVCLCRRRQKLSANYPLISGQSVYWPRNVAFVADGGHFSFSPPPACLQQRVKWLLQIDSVLARRCHCVYGYRVTSPI